MANSIVVKFPFQDKNRPLEVDGVPTEYGLALAKEFFLPVNALHFLTELSVATDDDDCDPVAEMTAFCEALGI